MPSAKRGATGEFDPKKGLRRQKSLRIPVLYNFIALSALSLIRCNRLNTAEKCNSRNKHIIINVLLNMV